MRLSSHALRQLIKARPPRGPAFLVIADTAAMREARRLPPALRWVPLDIISPGDAGGPSMQEVPVAQAYSCILDVHRINGPVRTCRKPLRHRPFSSLAAAIGTCRVHHTLDQRRWRTSAFASHGRSSGTLNIRYLSFAVAASACIFVRAARLDQAPSTRYTLARPILRRLAISEAPMP